jgi:hypothetical protein
VTTDAANDRLKVHILQCTLAQWNGSQSSVEQSQFSELLESSSRARRIYLEQMLDVALLRLVSRNAENDRDTIQ